jgi:AcrR family transcriptional regulator
MNTKERVLDAALTLFNAQGTADVSTNHIAEAAGISPGNLYYHYSNKEAIIRALFERLFAEWDAAFAIPPDHAPGVADVEALVRENFRIISAYAFIHRELVALLHNDHALHERFLQVRERGFTGFHELIAALVEGGALKPPETPQAVTWMAEICWLISEFWLSSLLVSGKPIDAAGMERGIDLMLHALKPYLIR